jgi:hypothetical protein
VSLTSFIEQDEVWAYLGRVFPKPVTPRPKRLVAPPRTKNYGTVGTAFDYFLRWNIQATNPRVRADQAWIAEMAEPMIRDRRRRRAAAVALARARRRHSRAMAVKRCGARVAESAIELARLDTVVRCGLGEEAIGTSVAAADVRDLRKLIAVVPGELFATSTTCLVNPGFVAADLVGGADADLVIGDTLIDIKTTADNKICLAYFNQLVGYFLLYRLAGFAAVRRQPQIRRLGVYMARYGELVTWNVSEIAGEREFARAVTWFEKHARRHGCARSQESLF